MSLQVALSHGLSLSGPLYALDGEGLVLGTSGKTFRLLSTVSGEECLSLAAGVELQGPGGFQAVARCSALQFEAGAGGGVDGHAAAGQFLAWGQDERCS